MVAQPGRISVREHEGLLGVESLRTNVGKVVNAPHGLVEERDEANRVRRRAGTRLVALGVSHVREVICRVEILAVPARREEHLAAKSVGTIVRRKAGTTSRRGTSETVIKGAC